MPRANSTKKMKFSMKGFFTFTEGIFKEKLFCAEG